MPVAYRWAALLLALPLSASAQDGPTDAEADAAVAAFRKVAEDSATREEDRILALRRLASVPHARVLAAVQPWLSKSCVGMRLGAVSVLAGFTSVPGSSRVLAAAWSAPANRGPEQQAVRIRILQAFGEMKAEDQVGILNLALLDSDPWIARAAAVSTGALRNRSSIDPLVQRLARLEGAEGDRRIPDGSPVADPVPGASDFSNRDAKRRANGEESGRAEGEPDARKTERQVLRPPLLEALRAITREKHETAAAWAGWWSKVRRDYRVPP